MLKINNTVFCSPYLGANAPKVLFQRIEECAETALLGKNTYTDCQLITNAIHLLLANGLYTKLFEQWDRLMPIDQTWIALRIMIQEAFQRHLNTTVPTARHHSYASALPYQNIFGALKDNDFNKDFAATVATQVAA